LFSANAAVSNSLTIFPLPKVPRSPPRFPEGQRDTCLAMLLNFSPLLRRSWMFFASVSVFTRMCAQRILSGMVVCVDVSCLIVYRRGRIVLYSCFFVMKPCERVSLNLLCELGFHKWEDYGKEVQIFWQEPGLVYGLTTKSKMVHEKRRCLRCGVRLKRVFTPNPDGTMGSVGWAPDKELVGTAETEE
jgi:hypothetical protein